MSRRDDDSVHECMTRPNKLPSTSLLLAKTCCEKKQANSCGASASAEGWVRCFLFASLVCSRLRPTNAGHFVSLLSAPNNCTCQFHPLQCESSLPAPNNPKLALRLSSVVVLISLEPIPGSTIVSALSVEPLLAFWLCFLLFHCCSYHLHRLFCSRDKPA